MWNSLLWEIWVEALIDTERKGCESIIHHHDYDLCVTMVRWVDVPYIVTGVTSDISSYLVIIGQHWIRQWLYGDQLSGHLIISTVSRGIYVWLCPQMLLWSPYPLGRISGIVWLKSWKLLIIYPYKKIIMMTSSNVNIILVTGPLWG